MLKKYTGALIDQGSYDYVSVKASEVHDWYLASDVESAAVVPPVDPLRDVKRYTIDAISKQTDVGPMPDIRVKSDHRGKWCLYAAVEDAIKSAAVVPPVDPNRYDTTVAVVPPVDTRPLEDGLKFCRYEVIETVDGWQHLYGYRYSGTMVGICYLRRRSDNSIEVRDESAGGPHGGGGQ